MGRAVINAVAQHVVSAAHAAGDADALLAERGQLEARLRAVNAELVGISREPTGPLAGITIIEAQQAITGPLGTMMLADMGATVIKIEPPTGPGDVNRPSGVRLGHESGDHSACTYGQSDSAASFHPAGTHQQVAARVLPAAPTAVTAAQISTTSTVGSVV